MNCERPYIANGGAYGCGQCLPCRINRRRIWTHRILLEAAQHEDNAFLTLTYGDSNLPPGNSVSPRELQLFFKRLRKISPVPIRYFACGEYGEQTGRPHYHLALFGYPTCERGVTRVKKLADNEQFTCCQHCDRIHKAWGKGQILLGSLQQESAAYVAGYITKKLTPKSPTNREYRFPEFARMSLRPGIGLGMMHELASTLLQHKLDQKMIDVPLSLQHGTKKLPLGRYLRRKLRTFIGREPNAPEAAMEEQKAEMQALRKTAWDNKTSLKTEVLQKSLGRRIQIEARFKRSKKGTLS